MAKKMTPAAKKADKAMTASNGAGKGSIPPFMKTTKAPKYEGSPKDKAADKKGAKKAGMDMKAWEKSPMDKKADAKGQKAMTKG